MFHAMILTTLVTTMIQATTLVVVADNACAEAPAVDRTLMPLELVAVLDKDAYLLRLLPTDPAYWTVNTGMVIDRTGDTCHRQGRPYTIALAATSHPSDQKPVVSHDFAKNTWNIRFTVLKGPHVHLVRAGNDDGSASKLYQIAYLGVETPLPPTLR